MNLFRLLLCLAGLATYFIVKQMTQTDSAPGILKTSPAGASEALPHKGTPTPLSPKPQTRPHAEILKQGDLYAVNQGFYGRKVKPRSPGNNEKPSKVGNVTQHGRDAEDFQATDGTHGPGSIQPKLSALSVA
jgi:hypothetical protein